MRTRDKKRKLYKRIAAVEITFIRVHNMKMDPTNNCSRIEDTIGELE